MNAWRVLRSIREGRKKKERDQDDFCGRTTPEQYNELLIVDPHFKIDIVSLMDGWRKEYLEKEKKQNTPFSIVKAQWINEGKDLEERRHRKHFIQSLIKKEIVLTIDNGQEMTIRKFLQQNKIEDIRILIAGLSKHKENTKKKYNASYRSFWKFIGKFLYGLSIKSSGKVKTLKKGIRALELSETAAVLNDLEKKAMQNDVALRDLLMIRLILYAGEGVEIKSIFDLRRENLNFSDNIVTLKKRHSGRVVNVKCSNDYMTLLKSYLGRRKIVVFENIDQQHLNQRLCRITKSLRIENVSLKSIQRTYIYLLRSNGLIH